MNIADNPGTQPETPPSVENETPLKTDEGKENPTTETGDDTQLKLDTFTKDEVNEIIRKRLARHEEGLPKKFGAETLEQLQDFIEKGKGYEELKVAHENTIVEMAALQEKLLFIENNIATARYDDVRTYFKGKEIEMTADNLAKQLKTHPEWLEQTKKQVHQIGNTKQDTPQKSEKDIALELLGVRK